MKIQLAVLEAPTQCPENANTTTDARKLEYSVETLETILIPFTALAYGSGPGRRT